LGAAALLLIYAFVGFEGAVVPAGEAKRPERDMPLGLLLGLGIVAIIYMLIQLVSQAAVPNWQKVVVHYWMHPLHFLEIQEQ